MARTGESPLVFGIDPGGQAVAASGRTIGSAEDPEQLERSLALLQAGEGPFLLRSYVHYKGTSLPPPLFPAEATRYARAGRRLDLVLCYHSPDGDLEDWQRFVRGIVRQYGPHLATLQVGEEPNNPDAATGGDGGFPNVRQAIVEGVLAAKDQTRRQGLGVRIGFNATLSFNPADDFWPDMAGRMDVRFLGALDYVGLDFFPDVFRPLPAADLTGAVAGVLAHFRNQNLSPAGIPPSVPIHITENGWPTGEGRPPERQAEVLEAIVRTVHEQRTALNIAAYEWFDLRDADSSNPDMLYQFGLLHDDYRPKPAFGVYRRLVAELGAQGW